MIENELRVLATSRLNRVFDAHSRLHSTSVYHKGVARKFS